MMLTTLDEYCSLYHKMVRNPEDFGDLFEGVSKENIPAGAECKIFMMMADDIINRIDTLQITKPFEIAKLIRDQHKTWILFRRCVPIKMSGDIAFKEWLLTKYQDRANITLALMALKGS